DWIATKGIWWVASVVVHTLILTTALLLMGNIVQQQIHTGIPVFEGGVSTVISDSAGQLDSFASGNDVQLESGESTSDPLAGETSGGGTAGGGGNGGTE